MDENLGWSVSLDLSQEELLDMTLFPGFIFSPDQPVLGRPKVSLPDLNLRGKFALFLSKFGYFGKKTLFLKLDFNPFRIEFQANLFKMTVNCF